jgi:hypothetical protein
MWNIKLEFIGVEHGIMVARPGERKKCRNVRAKDAKV